MKDKYYPGSYSLNEQVEIKVFPTFVPNEKLDAGLLEQLNSEVNIFVYRIEITNFREEWIVLLNRYWKIVDSDGEENIITGKGVVGETPRIYHGETFVYSSFCPLSKEWGTMEGYYGMADREGNHFQVEINRFYLIKEKNQQVNYVKRDHESR